MTEVKPLTNGVEIFVQNPETGGLPILEYILKYNSAEKSDEQTQTLTIPAQISPDNAQQNQVLKIEKIKPSTSYRLTITAKSRAGIGQQNGPITFRTLDRQVPDFKIVKTDENRNETCLNDRTCLIQWAIESDGGAPIIRSEIFYAKAKSDKNFDIDGSFSTPVSLDSSVSEYELTNLKPATSYIVVVKLFNEAGPNEQKARITTLKDSGRIPASIREAAKQHREGQPSKWVIFGIIFGIISFAVAIVAICVLIRVYRPDGKNKTDDAEQHSTLMKKNKDGDSKKDEDV